ncbi:MAG: 50S ribosomal protein L7/L12 [Candidatus Babeliales bacterium]
MSSQAFEKLITEIGNMSVIELNDFVKALEEKFGVSAAAMSAGVAAPAGAAQAAQADEKAEYDVKLTDAGAQKIQVIKALKGATSLSLSEAKEKVDGAPMVVASKLAKADAEKLKKELEAAGAKVELV